MIIPIQFSEPRPDVLEAMDAHLQFSNFENQWERTEVPGIFQRNTDGGTWADVKDSNEAEFLRAWRLTIAFIIQHDIDFQDIIDEYM